MAEGRERRGEILLPLNLESDSFDDSTGEAFGRTSTDTDDVTLPLDHRCSLEGPRTD